MFSFKNLLVASVLSALYLVPAAANTKYTLRGATAFRRDDGPSGDGGCDPCSDSCDIKRSIADLPRMLYGNDTSPWDANETMRWRKFETVNASGQVVAAYNLEFDCSAIPEVCNNMCYGVYCKKDTWSLTIRRDNIAQCHAARKLNACGSSNPNYCSAKLGFPAGYSCDEYPFASTVQGQTSAKTATRCVPKGQNSSQGGKISGLYRHGTGSGRLPDGTAFTVVLDKPGSSPNCTPSKSCITGTSVSGKTQR